MVTVDLENCSLAYEVDLKFVLFFIVKVVVVDSKNYILA